MTDADTPGVSETVGVCVPVKEGLGVREPERLGETLSEPLREALVVTEALTEVLGVGQNWYGTVYTCGAVLFVRLKAASWPKPSSSSCSCVPTERKVQQSTRL